MSVKSRFFQLWQLKNLYNAVEIEADLHKDAVYIAENLKEWIDTEKRGGYLINILRGDEIIFLENVGII